MASAEISKADDTDGVRRYVITATDDEGDSHTTRLVIPEDLADDEVDDYLTGQARRAHQVILNRKQSVVEEKDRWTTTPLRTVNDQELKAR